jgi:hypothetical protein
MTQIGEDVAIGVIATTSLAEEDKDKDKEKKCHLIVRVKRPSGKGPWYAFGMLGGSGEQDDLTGHTFCAHLDEGDSATWHGFYPKGAIVGWRNVSADDQIAGIADFFKYVAGLLYHRDADHPYDDEKRYELTRPQYDAAQAFASKWEADKVKYSLAKNNCTSYVVKDAAAAGHTVPSAGFPFSNPASFGKSLAKS